MADGHRHLPSRSSMSRPTFTTGEAELYHADCLAWLRRAPECSITAVVTDPPYGVAEYTREEQAKLRAGRGGV